jgi:hypothetical protein
MICHLCKKEMKEYTNGWHCPTCKWASLKPGNGLITNSSEKNDCLRCYIRDTNEAFDTPPELRTKEQKRLIECAINSPRLKENK